MVIGASVDTVESAQEIVEQHELTFPLACGLNAREFSAVTGASYDEENSYVHATGFIIRPNGKVAEAVYSTGPIGRHTMSECLLMIDYLSEETD